ncbi:Bug family tripartite tricarboxylate transporter substrate binding protein [Ferrovibrio sp.]|uniref:Bug family tripartite tricarboxylate transporter substrate binding protein n=1 Tax=Ferrovibrio sp. TaxID=1917215 RepID=UPI003D2B6723
MPFAISRRQFVTTSMALGAGSALGALPALPARAQAVDNLKLFVPANPGGGWDQTARSIEQALKAGGLIKGAQVTNVGGAGGAVGLPQFVNQWKGQGNALMVAGMVMVGALITNKSPVSMTQTVPVARLTGEFEVVVVPATSPLKSMADLAAAFKADPAKVSWAGGSAGGTDHILAGMIAKAVGGDPKKVAYVAYAGGGPAQAALLGAQVTCGISGYGEFAEQIKAGKLRALGISADKRQAGIDIPTIKEQGIDVELFNWRGVFAPPGVKDADRAAMIDLMRKMNQSAAWKEQLTARDWTDIFLAGDDYAKYIASEIARIGDILKELGLG